MILNEYCDTETWDILYKNRMYRPSINVTEMYDSILTQKGIHMKPMTELSFNILYRRYKKLGGTKKFIYDIKQ